MQPRPPLATRLEGIGSGTGDELLERFLSYVDELGLSLYPAQEEAILEIMAGKHVIVATPTGSGKSLIAFAMIFRALANGGRAFYTCPIKALVNEKFFQLTDAFGPDKVGMMTGDATVNADAPIIACTAEIAASMALREGAGAPIDAIVMDEFHYYADRDRGAAWHIPLLLLDRTHFLLMSATLGDATPFLARLKALTGREAALIEGRDRPVPLDFTYSEEPLHETVKTLVDRGKAPVYIVCFTQRSCAEEAQNLMSENYTTKEEKRRILEAIEQRPFDSPYGKEVVRFVKHGIGLHHAGLLPKYRLTVEKLAQDGLLKIICGTDTLGVGVNIPIRTVLFTKLCKFDGDKTTILSVREFQQIAGRAGRKGFDDEGSVVVQAPEHAIENKKIDRKKEQDPKKYKSLQRAKPPTKGFVNWDRSTFDRLISSKPEELVARFAITHGMLVDLLDNPEAGKRGGYGLLLALIEKAHVSEHDKRRERKRAPQMFRALRRAGIIEVERREGRRGSRAVVSADLQRDFSLMHALSLWLIDYVDVLHESKTDEDAYALSVLSAVEAILESPRVVLERQLDKLKGDKLAELKAAGVEYEERVAELEKLEHPKPDAESIYETFAAFSEQHPWASDENIRPKSIARDMFERYATFDEYVREYDLARVEGVLLRYLSEVVKTLEQSVPDAQKNDALDDIYFFLRDEVRSVDSSLLAEWEDRVSGRANGRSERAARQPRPLHEDPKAFAAWARREVHKLLAKLAAGDYAGAAEMAGSETMTAAEIETAMAARLEARGPLVVNHAARTSDKTLIRPGAGGAFELFQTLVDGEGNDDWSLEADILPGEPTPKLVLRRIGPA
jgi:superfamily II RNA helicase